MESFEYQGTKDNQKEKGAFFTPPLYAKLGAEMVKEAINLVPEGNDYIILDRCAGTGNLEEQLINVLGADITRQHLIISTIEPQERQVLKDRLKDKVKHIIEPQDLTTTKASLFETETKNELIDALTEEFVKMKYLQDFINNPKCSIIMIENPPYRNVCLDVREGINDRFSRGSVIKPWMFYEITKDDDINNNNGRVTKDLCNFFIWSAFHYYLRQPTDSYIIYSPCKYFKAYNLVNKQFKKGYIVNRKHFNASDGAISLMWWQNVNENRKEFNLPAIDIKDNKLVKEKDIILKKTHDTYDQYINGLIKTDPETVESHDFCKLNGDLIYKPKFKSIYNKKIIGQVIIKIQNIASYGRFAVLTTITQMTETNGYVTVDNLLNILPLFCASKYSCIYDVKWYERDTIFSSSDKGDEYMKDQDFLKSCLIWSCTTTYNHCKTLEGERFYRNELCFDTTNGETVASKTLKQFELNNDDKEILDLFNILLQEAKKSLNYKKNYTYGTHQIKDELNIKSEQLRLKLRDYYLKHIKDKLFKYELLK